MTTAYNDGYTQIKMQAGLFGITEAQKYFWATQSTVYKRYLDCNDTFECERQWIDGGISAMLDFGNQQREG